jgi:CheY-like chemotaxis protein
VSAAHAPDSVILRESLASTERLISEVISRAEDLRALTLLPDLEKCSLAAARASDCLADGLVGRPPAPAARSAQPRRRDQRLPRTAARGAREDIDRRLATNLDALRAQVGELLAATAPEANAALTPPPPAPEGGSGTLLVIDDNELSRELLGRYLRRQGHAVLAAASGAEAIAILQRERRRPDLPRPRDAGDERAGTADAHQVRRTPARGARDHRLGHRRERRRDPLHRGRRRGLPVQTLQSHAAAGTPQRRAASASAGTTARKRTGANSSATSASSATPSGATSRTRSSMRCSSRRRVSISAASPAGSRS